VGRVRVEARACTKQGSRQRRKHVHRLVRGGLRGGSLSVELEGVHKTMKQAREGKRAQGCGGGLRVR
jgi:hypothetical protein